MKEYKLPENIRDGLINYLANKPYKEVAEVIAVLANLEQLTVELV